MDDLQAFALMFVISCNNLPWNFSEYILVSRKGKFLWTIPALTMDEISVFGDRFTLPICSTACPLFVIYILPPFFYLSFSLFILSFHLLSFPVFLSCRILVCMSFPLLLVRCSVSHVLFCLSILPSLSMIVCLSMRLSVCLHVRLAFPRHLF